MSKRGRITKSCGGSNMGDKTANACPRMCERCTTIHSISSGQQFTHRELNLLTQGSLLGVRKKTMTTILHIKREDPSTTTLPASIIVVYTQRIFTFPLENARTTTTIYKRIQYTHGWLASQNDTIALWQVAMARSIFCSFGY